MKRLAGTSIKTALCAVAALNFGVNPAPAATGDYFGHKISIENIGDDFKALNVDGKEVERASQVFIDRTASVGEVDIVVASLGSGMVSCSLQTFFIVFAKGNSTQTFSPGDDCRGYDYEIKPESISFTIAPSPSQDGEKRRWTPAGGLTAPEKIAFMPDPAQTWANVRLANVSRPAILFQFSDINAQLHELIGKDFADVISIVDGVGHGEFKDEMYVGTSCMQHMCGDVEALVIADVPSRRVYLAWKLENKAIVVRPEVTQWPKAARIELKTWAKTWQKAGNDDAALQQPMAAPQTHVEAAPTLDAYEAILAKQRDGLKAIAGFDYSSLSPTDAKQHLKTMAAQLDLAVGPVPSSSNDPKLHEVYVTGAREGIGKAFAAIRLWEGVEIARLTVDRKRVEMEAPKLHELAVLHFKDVEASLLRDDIERLVNNPNLGAREIQELAMRALIDDGQKSDEKQAAKQRPRRQ